MQYLLTESVPRHIKIIHTMSNSLGWVSIYTRASSSCKSTFEDSNELLNFRFLLHASTDAARKVIYSLHVYHYSEAQLPFAKSFST